MRLDFYITKPVLKSSLIAILFVFGLFFMYTSVSLLLVNLAWYIALMSQNVFAAEEIHRLERLYGILPLPAKDRVLGRYLAVLLSYCIAVVVSLGLTIALGPIFYPVTLSIEQLLYSLSGSLLIFAAIIAIQFPIYFKFGHSKGKFYAMIPFVVVMGLAMLPVLLGDIFWLYSWVLQHPGLASLLAVVLSCALLVVSYGVSSLVLRSRSR